MLPDHTPDEPHPYLPSQPTHLSADELRDYDLQTLFPDIMGPPLDWISPFELMCNSYDESNTNITVPPREQQRALQFSTDGVTSYTHPQQALPPSPPPQNFFPSQHPLPHPSYPLPPPQQPRLSAEQPPSPAEEPPRRGRGRPPGSKDTKPRKRKDQAKRAAEAGSSITAPVKSSEHRVDRRGQLAAGMSKSHGPSAGTTSAGPEKKSLDRPAQVGAGTLLTPELSPDLATPPPAEARVVGHGQVDDGGAVPREPKMVSMDLDAQGRIEKRYM